jgi:hypothetical protein
MRFSENPGKRVQDGLKKRWLCGECEATLAKDERDFANKLFFPWVRDKTYRIPYDAWLLRFCVSISWRVLRDALDRGPIGHFSAGQRAHAEHAADVWREFLLGLRPHPGRFEQHIVPFDAIDEADAAGLPKNFNRFMMRAIMMDVIGSESTAMTFAKLGRFCIFGLIDKGGYPWIGSKVHVNHGVLSPTKYVLPLSLLDYFKQKAASHAEAAASIPEHQQDRIEAEVLANVDRLIASDQFEAMMHDRRVFGHSAIIRKQRSSP